LEPNTRRRQLWLVPGLQVLTFLGGPRLQAFFEQPLYQSFEGRQLASDLNLRLSVAYSLPFGSGKDEE
jgi:hypothetical protein